MPNEPMSAEDFARRWIDGELRESRYSEIKELAELIAERDAQLIASTLQAAADRFCDKCMDCTAEEVGDEKPTCRKLRPILAPLDKTDKGE